MILSDEPIGLLDSFLATCQTVMARANELPPPDEVNRRVRHRYYFYLQKAVSTFGAFDLLVRHGYPHEAKLLARANFELLVNLLYYHTSPIQLSERFEAFFHIASEWELAAFDVEGDRGRIPASEKARITTLELDFCSTFGDKKFPRHWSGFDQLIERAKKVGLEHTYRTTYHLQSDIAHCGVLSEASYITFADAAPAREMAALDPTESYAVIGAACGDMWHCLRTIEEGLGLQSYEVIHDLYDRYAEYSKQQMRES